MSTGLDASTVAPGKTAPDASRTTPAMDACARAADGTSTALKRTKNAIRLHLPMSPLRDRRYFQDPSVGPKASAIDKIARGRKHGGLAAAIAISSNSFFL